MVGARLCISLVMQTCTRVASRKTDTQTESMHGKFREKRSRGKKISASKCASNSSQCYHKTSKTSKERDSVGGLTQSAHITYSHGSHSVLQVSLLALGLPFRGKRCWYHLFAL